MELEIQTALAYEADSEGLIGDGTRNGRGFCDMKPITIGEF